MTSNDVMSDIFNEIRTERSRQRVLWPNDHRHIVGAWLAIINGRLGKLSLAALGPKTSPVYCRPWDLTPKELIELQHRSIQLAAVAIAFAEKCELAIRDQRPKVSSE